MCLRSVFLALLLALLVLVLALALVINTRADVWLCNHVFKIVGNVGFDNRFESPLRF